MTIKELAREIAVIKDNHLQHMAEDIDRIEKKIEKLDSRLWWILTLLVGGLVVPVVIDIVIKNL